MLPQPVIFGVQLNWYWHLLFIGIAASLIMFLYLEKKSPSAGFRLFDKILMFVVLFVIAFWGGRFVSFCENYLYFTSRHEAFTFDLHTFLRWKDSRFYGGLLIDVIIVYSLILLFRKNHGLLMLTANFGIALALGLSITKWGCFLDGHLGCCGIPTTMPWGVHYDYGQAYSAYPLHPVQIYDSICYFAVFATLLFLQKRMPTYKPYLFPVFLILISVYNICIEFIIANFYYFQGFSLAQWVYCFILVCSVMMVYYHIYHLHSVAR